MAKAPTNRDVEIDLSFPLEGINEERSYTRQRQGTTIDGQNVRSFEPSTGRARGCQRPGLEKFFDDPAVPTLDPAGAADANINAIQYIGHLVSTELAPPADYGRFTYAQAADAGFGIANGSSGSSIYSGIGAAAGFIFANSCWDVDGNLYVAQVNQTTGAVRVYLISTTGTISWTNTGLTCATGANRNVPGMVAIGDYLFVALTTTSPPSSMTSGECRISRLNRVTGVMASGDATWRVSSASFYMQWSTASVNCLGSVGGALAYEGLVTGYGGILVGCDPTTNAGQQAYGYHLHTGTLNNSKTRVVSDGTFLYVIASCTTAQIRKYSTGFVELWTSTAADSPNDITFDKKTSQLIAAATTAPSLRSLNLSNGTIVSTAVASSVFWDCIDSDDQGNFITVKNSTATNNAAGFSQTLGVVWGPSSLSNAVHTGFAVNKGGGGTPPVNGARQIRPLVMAAGELRTFSETGSVAITEGDSFNRMSRVVDGAQNGLNMYFTDGAGYFYYKAQTNEVLPWVATSPGTMPMDSPVPIPGRRICTWNGRTVIYGFKQQPQLWFMSKQFDPLDWDYDPETTTVTQATNGNVSQAGLVGDLIRCMIPYSDDTLVVLCDHTIWLLKGDPLIGGKFDNVSRSIGGLDGKAWAIDGFGQMYFYAPIGGIFKMTPGAMPTRVSQPIERQLDNIDVSANSISLEWDLQLQCLWVWVTPFDATATATNFCYEERTNSWQKDVYKKSSHQPFATWAFDGDLPEDRRILVGGRDGYMRIIQNIAADDDGHAIESYVWLGPISTKALDDILLKELQATLGDSSGSVRWDIHVGRTVEEAFASASVRGGIWTAGRNRVSLVNRSGFSVFVRLSALNPFTIERIRAKFEPQGMVRRIM